jgi:hypothetical protein
MQLVIMDLLVKYYKAPFQIKDNNITKFFQAQKML